MSCLKMDKAKRTYIVRCPVDITLKVTPPDDESGEGSIESEKSKSDQFSIVGYRQHLMLKTGVGKKKLHYNSICQNFILD